MRTSNTNDGDAPVQDQAPQDPTQRPDNTSAAQHQPDRTPDLPPPAPTPPVAPPNQQARTLLDKIDQRSTGVARPQSGFRSFIYRLTNGRVNPGLSPEEQRVSGQETDIRAPISGVKHVCVWSQKGGVGKTTSLVGMGITTASLRTDKILGLDVNPDGGSLAVRVPITTPANILDMRDALLAGDLPPSQFDRYVNKAAHRFDTIVMPPGQKPAQPLSGADYVKIAEALEERYPYKIIFTDCGTDLSAPVMEGVLKRSHQLVVVTTTVKDEAMVTAGGLEALIREGYDSLVANAVTILVNKAPKDPDAVVQREIEATAETIEEHFRGLTGSVVHMPYDSRIRIGGVFDPATISQASKDGYRELSGDVALRLSEMR